MQCETRATCKSSKARDVSEKAILNIPVPSLGTSWRWDKPSPFCLAYHKKHVNDCCFKATPPLLFAHKTFTLVHMIAEAYVTCLW